MYETFDMDWIQNVLEIKPVFSSDKTMWSDEINKKLTEEALQNKYVLSGYVYDALMNHFNGDWGDISDERELLNDNTLKNYYNGQKTNSSI